MLKDITFIDIVLSIVIGIALACLLAAWWTS